MIKLSNNLEIDRGILNKIFKKKISQNKRPLMITFLTQSTSFFDIFRLIKLYELNRAGFYILLIVEESEKKEEADFFNRALEKFVPNNKKIFLYKDIISDILSNRAYNQLLLSYKIENLNKFKESPKMGQLSLSDINRFLAQYFILKNSKSISNQEPDFYLTTQYKEFLFKSIPEFDASELPIKILLKDLSLSWNFISSVKILEKKINEEQISENRLFSLKKALSPVEKLLQNKTRERDFLSLISEIKKLLEGSNEKKEYFATKSDFKKILTLLSNETRRKIIFVLEKRGPLKAEEIRKEINLNLKKKHSLSNIIKHLNLLLNVKLICKTKRFYEMNVTRIVLDVPLSWFSES